MSPVTQRTTTPLDVLACPLAGIRQVEASAGTGKTWSLCGLYARLLLERELRVQDILVVTFTNAATAELRERIRARLADVLAHLQRPGEGDAFVEQLVGLLRAQGQEDDRLAARLTLALATFDEAAIFTIHGFCQRALADAAFTAHAPLALELAADDAHWAQQAAADFWRRHVASDAIEPALAARLVTTKASPQAFAGLLRRRLARPLAQEIWPDELADATVPDTARLLRAHAEAAAMWTRRRDAVLRVMDDALAGDHLKRTLYTEHSLADAAGAWDELALQPDGVAALARQASSDDTKRFMRFELLAASRLEAGTKRQRTTPRDDFFGLAQALVEARQELREPLEGRRLALVKAMLDEGERDVRAAKRAERIIGFDDLLGLLHERLESPQGGALAQSLATRFPAALIDEFQDTDPLQFAIFRRLYEHRPGPVFFIGDPKQAIYSFRNADLHTYLAAGDLATAHESLVENQRSTPELIGALNALFRTNPKAFILDGLSYHAVGPGRKRRRPLRDDSRDGDPPAALQVWMLPADAGAGGPMTCRDAERAAIDATAADIARLLSGAQAGLVALGREGAPCAEAADPGEAPLQASDIAVLVRTNAQGSRVRQALHRLGVGSVELAQDSIYASGDAEELDRVLAAVLEPSRERTLKAALSTQTMGLDAAQIDALASDEIALAEHVQRFAAWRDAWQKRGIAFMLRRWMSDAGVAARLLARPEDGERRLTNLLHLVERLHEASEDHEQPRALLRWLQAQRAQSDGPTADEAAQLRLESDSRLVRIVTVHKAKGLEYPVVYCPLLWTPMRMRPSELEGLVYHDGHRLVVDFRESLLDARDIEELKRRARVEAAAEEVRLLYVALTRAANRCVLVAGCAMQGGGKTASPTATARAPLNWLVAGFDHEPREWDQHKPGVAEIVDAWNSLAQRCEGTIVLQDLPMEPGRPLVSRPLPPERLAALDPPHPLPRAWRIGSFSGLAHGAAVEDAARERDALATRTGVRVVEDEDVAAPAAEEAAIAPVPVAMAADDILRFPRGPAAGECIHEVFERIAFTDPAGWPQAILAALRTWRTLRPARAGGAAASTGEADLVASPGELARHAAMLERMARDVLDTPLPLGTETPLRLATLPRERRLVELEFHLGVDRLEANTLQALLARAGIEVPPLAFTPLRGWLKGFIDLVFEHEGRWFVLDWKSNHLGDTPAAYAAPALARVMHAQAYRLQAVLYLLALDRLLRARLPEYDPARHLGGAVYLFVRGVRPAWQDAHDNPTGLVLHHPGVETLQRLSRLLDDAEAVA